MYYTPIYDTIILGGGASGLLAAATLARQGFRVALLEKQSRVGRKLLSTGNGRCNLTNLNAKASDYHGSRQAAQMALRAYPPKKIVEIFGTLGIPCVSDAEGRVYPMSKQAASVLDALRLSCEEAGVKTLTDFPVAELQPAFIATTSDGRMVRGKTALVCTGGLAAPKLGASGEGYRMLEAYGHRILPRFPAIAALKTPPEAVRGLKGIRADGTIRLVCDDEVLRVETGEVLFAEAGISGIAAMQLARQANECLRAGKACAARLELLPDATNVLRARAGAVPWRRMEDFLTGIVARRLGQTLVKAAGIDFTLMAGELSNQQIDRLSGLLSGWTLPVTGTQDFDQAQVTAGGASLGDFDLRTMQSHRWPGLFAAGEILDVDGDCGGFNLQWAWSSALMAASGIGDRLNAHSDKDLRHSTPGIRIYEEG